ncbi:MAG: sigma-70 family RNA polymerase sigma factor [Acidobacteria bacterium]|nr:sigma-70 family RNA polymerase sigma factor [Acidobacteriota bacterium]
METQLQPAEEVPLEPSDIELVERTRAGDNEAFGELWDRHRQAGLRAAASLTNDHDPEDLVQEAFLRILSAIRSNAGPREVFRPYLYMVLRSISMNWKSTYGPTTDLDVLDYVADPADSFENQIIDKTITGRAFASLRTEWRTVLWYSEVEGMTPRDIAPLLGMSATTVAALTYRAREGLRAAWLQAHLNDVRADEKCQWTVERLGKYNRSTLSQRNRDRVQEHLTTCIKCSILVEELDHVGRNLGMVLLPLFLGPAGMGLMDAVALSTPLGGVSATRSGASHVSKGSRVGLSFIAAAVAVAGIVAAATAMTPVAKDTVAGTQVTINPAPSNTKEPAPSPAPIGSGTVVTPHDKAPTGTQMSAPLVIPPKADAPLMELPATRPKAINPAAVQLPFATPSRAPSVVPAPAPAPLVKPTSNPSATSTQTPSPTTPPVVLAKPVIVSTVDRGLFLPLLSGTGVAGALVYVLAGGQEVAESTVDSAGMWSVTPEVVPGPDGTAQFTAYQTLNSLTSATTAPTAPIQLQTPTIISLNTVQGVRQITFEGPAGSLVEAVLDGKPTGNYHPMNGQPVTRDLPSLGAGTHMIGLRFVDIAKGLHGATITATIVVS